MQIPRPEMPESITVTSPNFAAGDHIPTRFTCKGAGIAPAFGWVGVPTRARALAVVVSDPDAPRGTFLHWLVTGLAAADGGIEEGGSAPAGSREWPNSGRSASWVPPCPPSGTHRYFFGVYALDAPVDAATTQQVLDEIGKHTIGWGTLLGLVDH
ncbi:MAG: YbhB/YbcL family Raf kinase inhibitor-like protein [Acidobacteriota bacterium]|nr:YbhB/YbcL family Raf kinase inhibitor-like protein [Acidobacteriota bacterium]